MPKKRPGMTPEEQSAAFIAEAERRMRSGDLDPVQADRILDKLVREKAGKPQKSAG